MLNYQINRRLVTEWAEDYLGWGERKEDCITLCHMYRIEERINGGKEWLR